MIYFVTGGSGFIGKRLVRRLLERPGASVYVLMREATPERMDALHRFRKADQGRVIPIVGDLTRSGLGISQKDREALAGRIDHVFHLGAVYDLRADPELEMTTNIEGTRHAMAFAEAIRARRFHHISSIAAAGLYEGVFREDMFEESGKLSHPYFASKQRSEAVVRDARSIPWRIYRPGIVVGDSQTGEMDKIDGPYYFFKLIQKARRLLPPWMPIVGIEGGRINLVPVDFVAAALDHLAHLEEGDRRCYHLTDPKPRRVGDIFSLFLDAAHAPRPALRINAALFNLVPAAVAQGLWGLTPLRRIAKTLMSRP
jgi:thioester reductase-like protein